MCDNDEPLRITAGDSRNLIYPATGRLTFHPWWSSGGRITAGEPVEDADDE